MTFKPGNEHRIQPGDRKSNGLGRPKSAVTIRRETSRALRVAAGPLVAIAIERALSGSEPALCAVLNLLASGFGEPRTKRVEAPDSAPIVVS